MLTKGCSVPQDFSWIENYKLIWLALVTWCCYFTTPGKDKKRWKLITQINNNVSMDYPPALGLEAGVCYCLSLDIILKFSKAAILEFSDSLTQILMVFFVQENNWWGDAMQIFFRSEWLYARQPGTLNLNSKCPAIRTFRFQVPDTQHINAKCLAL